MNILFIVSSSQIGGAEKQFIRTVNELKETYNITMCVLGKSGPKLTEYVDAGCATYISNGSLISDITTVLISILRVKPQVTVSWLYRADLLNGFFSRLLKVKRVIISARNTSWPGATKLKLLLLKWNAVLNADVVIANSNRSVKYHASLGYPQSKFIIIRNFIPKSNLNYNQKNIETLGVAARPIQGKGHFQVIKVAKELRNLGYKMKVSFIGPDLLKWTELINFITTEGIEVELIDGQTEITSWLETVDVYLSISDCWESDSNSIIEAIMFGIPVIASDLSAIEDIQEFMRIVDVKDTNKIAYEILDIRKYNFQDLKIELDMVRNELSSKRDTTALANLWKVAIAGERVNYTT